MKKLKISIYLLLFTALSLIISCKGDADKKHKINTISVFAAAGTYSSSNDICKAFTEKNKIAIETNFASSGTLARQISNGAETDIYISANKQWIDYLNNQKILTDSSIDILAHNKLVFICPATNENLNINFTKDFDIASTIKNKIAIGNPEYVPVGKYAKQMFDSLGWYEPLKEQMLLTKDVISVVNYVQLGECDWGIVYYSQAIHAKNIRIVCDIPEGLYDPVIFYISMLKEASESSYLLYDFFKSEETKEVLINNGFTINDTK